MKFLFFLSYNSCMSRIFKYILLVLTILKKLIKPLLKLKGILYKKGSTRKKKHTIYMTFLGLETQSHNIYNLCSLVL